MPGIQPHLSGRLSGNAAVPCGTESNAIKRHGGDDFGGPTTKGAGGGMAARRVGVAMGSTIRCGWVISGRWVWGSPPWEDDSVILVQSSGGPKALWAGYPATQSRERSRGAHPPHS